MLYEEFGPPARQCGRVATYWHFAVREEDPPAFEHVIVPDGTASLACAWIAPAGRAFASYVGPRRTALRLMVYRDSRYWGVRFKPGAAPLAGVEGLLEKSGGLGEILPEAESRIVGRVGEDSSTAEVLGVLEGVVDELMGLAGAVDGVVARAMERVEEAHGLVRVEELAEEAGLSARQFLRRFRAAAGLTPKEYARMRRVRWACVQAVLGEEEAGWAGVAGGSGFADQAHLSREFRRVFGWTPRMTEEYLKRIEHRRVRG